jgi:Sec-independent protein secretion pathway component TatC
MQTRHALAPIVWLIGGVVLALIIGVIIAAPLWVYYIR